MYSQSQAALKVLNPAPVKPNELKVLRVKPSKKAAARPQTGKTREDAISEAKPPASIKEKLLDKIRQIDDERILAKLNETLIQ